MDDFDEPRLTPKGVVMLALLYAVDGGNEATSKFIDSVIAMAQQGGFGSARPLRRALKNSKTSEDVLADYVDQLFECLDPAEVSALVRVGSVSIH